ncbi:MAG: hypothetical protein WB473_03840, partial [Pedococcus sp.]
IHGVGDAAQYNSLSIRSRVDGYPVAFEHEGAYTRGGVYSLGISGDWAVWTETSEIITTDNGDVEWSVVALNLKTKMTRVVATSIKGQPTLAPKAAIGNGVIAFGVPPRDRRRATPGSRPDPVEYVRLDETIATLHTLSPALQYDPLTVATSEKGVLLAVLEKGKEGITEMSFDGQQGDVYVGDKLVSTIGYGRFGGTDPALEGPDGAITAPTNLSICELPCTQPTLLVKGAGVSEQEMGRSIVTFSGERIGDVATGRTGDITVLTLDGQGVDNLKVGGLVYGGWGVYEDAVAWLSPSSDKPSARTERIHLRSYTVVK